jgi:hypothetical protein
VVSRGAVKRPIFSLFHNGVVRTGSNLVSLSRLYFGVLYVFGSLRELWCGLLLVLSLETSFVFAQTGPPSAPTALNLANPANSVTAPNSARDSIIRLIVLLTGEPFDSNETIARMVGNPWRLEERTLIKLETLSPRVRFQIYATLAEFGSGSTLGDPQLLSARGGDTASPTLWSVSFNRAQSSQFQGRLADTVLGHFSTDELIDLGVFALSKLPFFPRTEGEWNRFRSRLSQADVYLALGYLAAAAAFDSAIFQFTGKLVQFGPHDSWRLGWVAEVRGLGVSLEPRVRGGLALTSGYLELIGVFSQDFNSALSTDRRMIEVSLLEHLLSRLRSPLGWELSLALRAQHVLENPGNPTREGLWTGNVDAYARRRRVGGIPTLNFLAHFSGRGNTNADFSGQLELGLEEESHGVIGSLRIASGSNQSVSEGVPAVRWGVFVGGSLDSQTENRRVSLSMRAARVREALDGLRRSDLRRTRWSQRFLLGLRAADGGDLLSELRDMNRFSEAQFEVLRRNYELLYGLCFRGEGFPNIDFSGRNPEGQRSTSEQRTRFERCSGLEQGDIERAEERLILSAMPERDPERH